METPIIKNHVLPPIKKRKYDDMQPPSDPRTPPPKPAEESSLKSVVGGSLPTAGPRPPLSFSLALTQGWKDMLDIIAHGRPGLRSGVSRLPEAVSRSDSPFYQYTLLGGRKAIQDTMSRFVWDMAKLTSETCNDLVASRIIILTPSTALATLFTDMMNDKEGRRYPLAKGVQIGCQGHNLNYSILLMGPPVRISGLVRVALGVLDHP